MKQYGRVCNNCGKSLSESDYRTAGSWHYDCPKCGYRYRGFKV